MIADSTNVKNESTVANRKWPERFSSGLSWSPDGKTIAVAVGTAGKRDEILAVSVADGVVNRIGDRDWAEVSNVVWLADGSGLVMMGRDGGRNNQIWLVPYPSGETRKLTSDLNHYHVESLSLSADGKLAVLQGQIRPSIWIAPDGDPRQARRVLEGTETRQEGLSGLTWTPAGHLLYAASVADSRTIWETNGAGSHRQLIPLIPVLRPVASSASAVTFPSSSPGWSRRFSAKTMTRVVGSGAHEISEVTGKGSRAKVIDSNAMARVEVVSLISTKGRVCPCTLATKIRPSKQSVPKPLSNVGLSLEGECQR